MTKPKVLIALGSTSDLKKFPVLNDLEKETDIEWYRSVASGHRMKDRVEKHFLAHLYDLIIAGAGFTNGLHNQYIGLIQSIVKKRPHVLPVGLPISESRTDGLSSLLSSSEFPPGIPAVSVGVDQMGHAIGVARNLVTTPYERVVLFPFTKDGAFEEKATGLLEKLGVPYHVAESQGCELSAGDLPLVIAEGVASVNSMRPAYLQDKVIIMTQTQKPNWDEYAASKGVKNVVTVGLKEPGNLALFGAKVIARNNAKVGGKIVEYTQGTLEKYAGHEEVVRINPD